jgi:hypothetical protein
MLRVFSSDFNVSRLSRRQGEGSPAGTFPRRRDDCFAPSKGV